MIDDLNSKSARFSVLIIIVIIFVLIILAKNTVNFFDTNKLISYIESQALPTDEILPTTKQKSVITQSSTVSASVVADKNITETTKVIRVIDGDTIEIEGGQKVRYIGIDTPETKDPRRPVGCYGQAASDKNKTLVEGKVVELEKDVSQTDKYGRLLRYVYVDGQMVNQILVAQGYAKASTYPPDVKYQDLFHQAENRAKDQNLGLWSFSCNAVN